MPRRPADCLIQEQRDDTAMRHPRPALIPRRDNELGDRTVRPGDELQLQAFVIERPAPEAVAVEPNLQSHSIMAGGAGPAHVDQGAAHGYIDQRRVLGLVSSMNIQLQSGLAHTFTDASSVINRAADVAMSVVT